MDTVSLYVPDSVPTDFLVRATPLITLVPALVEPYALFDRSVTCACATRDALALRPGSIIVTRDQHAVLGFPLYALPPDCTLEETGLVVTWLFRHYFKTFGVSLEHGSLQRRISTQLFRATPCGPCCTTYHLLRDPVFLLKDQVLSLYGTGPTLDSVLKKEF